MSPLSATNGRIAVLDWLKAAAIVNMVLYHALYDAAFLFGQPDIQAFMRSSAAFWWERSICGTFILVSGFLSLHSRRPFRRAIRILGAALCVTVVTLLFTPQFIILFGILHFLGTASLLTALAAPVLQRIPAYWGLAACIGLFWLTRTIPYGHWPWGTPLPPILYDVKFLLFAGFWPAGSGLVSSDYFPLLPWLFVFWAGLFLERAMRGTHMEAACTRIPSCCAVQWLSRHALAIYLLHQPVAAAIVWLILHLA